MSKKLSDVKIEGDKLDAIFNAQTKFRKILGTKELENKGLTVGPDGHVNNHKTDSIVDLMTEQEKGERLMGLIHAIQSELDELKDTVYWKWWSKEGKDSLTKNTFRKDNKIPDGVANAKEEIADIMCFLGDMCACVGMDAKELAQINVRKTQVNIDRQDNNYSMGSKTGEDSEKLWEEIGKKTKKEK